MTNFLTLYGGGVSKLATALKVTEDQAQEIRESVFKGSPRLRPFMRAVTQRAEKRGYIWDWMGRRLQFPDPRFAYKAVNHLIQGGSASIIKEALFNLYNMLRGSNSYLLLTVHDEILAMVRDDELHLIPRMVRSMEAVYPARSLPMKVSVAVSKESWADLEEVTDWGNYERGNFIQTGEDSTVS
jgi:DNA polymerase-1